VAAGLPNREETRLVSLAADQLGLALRRDELTATATAAEVARQSDALKTALLTSVSHDLRTPLASIRAGAGTLMDPAIRLSAEETRETASAIDSEAERLNRLVRNLLDLSRIEGGALKPDIEVIDLDEAIEVVVGRLAPLFVGRPPLVDLDPDLPPVTADAVYLDAAVTNILENAARYAGQNARVRVVGRIDSIDRVDRGASIRSGARVVVSVEDDGPGVPPETLPHLFEKFYRVPGRRDDRRRGMGIGMSVVKGLVEAMGGAVAARRSELGGLAVDIWLAPAPVQVAAVTT
jgi:two-component system sensor histidine kinase KdpD